MAQVALLWMAHALALIGVKEVPGPANSPTITGWLKKLKAWWTDDATPWCGVFVAHVLQQAGQALPVHWYRAKAWLAWGQACPPAYGAICILDREGGGHVFFVTGVSKNSVWGIGGNQSDKVCEAKFARARVLGFRWPDGLALPAPLAPVADSGGAVSRNEK